MYFGQGSFSGCLWKYLSYVVWKGGLIVKKYRAISACEFRAGLFGLKLYIIYQFSEREKTILPHKSVDALAIRILSVLISTKKAPHLNNGALRLCLRYCVFFTKPYTAVFSIQYLKQQGNEMVKCVKSNSPTTNKSSFSINYFSRGLTLQVTRTKQGILLKA